MQQQACGDQANGQLFIFPGRTHLLLPPKSTGYDRSQPWHLPTPSAGWTKGLNRVQKFLVDISSYRIGIFENTLQPK